MTHARWLDGDGYPTDAALERITAWSIETRTDLHALVEFVRDLWAYADCGYFGVTEEPGKPPTWNLSTAGWSGNESVIYALRKHPLFWPLCWVSSRRGGHHVFCADQMRFPDDTKVEAQP